MRPSVDQQRIEDPGGIMTASTMTAISRTDRSSPLAGWICLAGALIGLAQGLFMMVVSPVVGEDRYSYPFTPTGFTIAQLSFGVQHLMLLVGVVALARASWTRRSRLAVVGFWIAAVGFLLLTAMELLALTAANAATASPEADLVNNLYGIPTIICGIGLLIGGVGFVQASRLSGWRRWLPLILGIYVFVPLMPAIFAPYVWGRIAISVWMLLFAGLGWMMIRPGAEKPV
jgi:hypothetical protein